MPFDGTEYRERDDAIRKLDQVIALLSSSDRWCKGALYRLNKQRCILGALQAVDAARELRRPVLEAICQVTGRNYRHIETFNDARSTTHPLVMQVLGGYSCEEIAAELGCKPGAVMTQLFRARQKLRALLDGGASMNTKETAHGLP